MTIITIDNQNRRRIGQYILTPDQASMIERVWGKLTPEEITKIESSIEASEKFFSIITSYDNGVAAQILNR